MLTLPRCEHCNRVWFPRRGTVASKDFCDRCRRDRRNIAKEAFGLKALTAEDADGRYILPRALRGRWPKRG
jgi:hypothetical protein